MNVNAPPVQNLRCTSPPLTDRRVLAVGLFLGGIWLLTIITIAPHWRDNPVYAYGWLVPPLALFFGWRRASETLPEMMPAVGRSSRALKISLWLSALGMLPFVWLQQDYAFNRMDCALLTIWATALTWLAARGVGGTAAANVVLFPALFILSAVPWPHRWETTLTIHLMQFVTASIAELLNLFGYAAVAEGTVLNTSRGPVGVAEACSGIQSLQASLMFGLAIGEFFQLRRRRRVVLVVLALCIAIVVNLARTLTLSLLVEHGGASALDRYHNLVGNVALALLPLPLLAIGRLLQSGATIPAQPPGFRLLSWVRQLNWPQLPQATLPLVIGGMGFAIAAIRFAVLDRVDPPMNAPFFTIQAAAGITVEAEELPEVTRRNLGATSTTFLRLQAPELPNGSATAYHFYWSPTPGNRFVPSHRPDICVPASGWTLDGPIQTVKLQINGMSFPCYAFNFSRDSQRALQLWGLWANGQPLAMHFTGSGGDLQPHPDWSGIPGRHRPAVEVLSCALFYHDTEPPLEQAIHLLQSVFAIRPPTGQTSSALLSNSPAMP